MALSMGFWIDMKTNEIRTDTIHPMTLMEMVFGNEYFVV